jgi:hypothetical protein
MSINFGGVIFNNLIGQRCIFIKNPRLATPYRSLATLASLLAAVG